LPDDEQKLGVANKLNQESTLKRSERVTKEEKQGFSGSSYDF